MTQVNRRARDIIADLREYRQVMEHARLALWALMSMHSWIHRISIKILHRHPPSMMCNVYLSRAGALL